MPEPRLPGVVEDIRLNRMRIPLKKPYYLSFGTLTHFDTVVCELTLDGRTALGETTPLPGYSPETADGAWAWALEHATVLKGLPAEEFSRELDCRSNGSPFYRAAFHMALESAQNGRGHVEPGGIPAVTALAGDTAEALAADTVRAAKLGFRTLKLKVGRDLDAELPGVDAVLAALPEGVRLRIDANQGLRLEEALRLWDHIDHPGLEYLEQPFPRGDWESVQRLIEQRPGARICLDESVFTMSDLDEVERLARPVAVKLKYMKQGSEAELVRCARRAMALGCPVTLGNGVQSDIGSVSEYLLYRSLGLDTAAELNGFAKQKQGILSESLLTLEGGEIRFTPPTGPMSLSSGTDAVRVDAWPS